MGDYFESQYAGNLARKGEIHEQRKAKEGRIVNFTARPRLTAKQMTMRIALIAVIFAVAVTNVFVLAAINDTNRIIAEKQEDYDINLSRIAEYDARLNALASPEKIEKTAVEKLGLVKLAESDWQYISINEANSVIVADGRVNS